ncbi:MAG TPA: type ISP restriction/modification enzyme, partial [Thermoanaerobaculia bacterium]|nr:type ISP restriction/modification enzyme [Thermoanaerobaculia bacterium]
EGPGYLFAPRDARLAEEYGRGILLTDLFPVHSAGIVTGRDAFVIDRDLAALRLRILRLRDGGPDELFRYGREALKDTGTWRLADARRRVRADERWDERFAEVLYRPFDSRFLFDSDDLIERPRRRVMDPMLAGRNLGLVLPRQSGEEPAALVTETIVAHKAVSAYDINFLFPLDLLELGRRVPNVSPDLLARFARDYGEEIPPREILHYVYAVLWSPAWRSRYAAFLREGFPRIPFPRDRGSFLEMAGHGARLVDLHLLRSDELTRPAVRFEGRGTGRLARSRRKAREYLAAERRVVVNEEGQSFLEISPEVWAFRIGGYPVLDHWLADRAGCVLRYDEIEDFRRMATALTVTLTVRRRIDSVLFSP